LRFVIAGLRRPLFNGGFLALIAAREGPDSGARVWANPIAATALIELDRDDPVVAKAKVDYAMRKAIVPSS
jgi:hypothetical protein